MNHNYVITLDKMPGWNNYNLTSVRNGVKPQTVGRFSVRGGRGFIELNIAGMNAQTVELFNLRGARVATLNKGAVFTIY